MRNEDALRAAEEAQALYLERMGLDRVKTRMPPGKRMSQTEDTSAEALRAADAAKALYVDRVKSRMPPAVSPGKHFSQTALERMMRPTAAVPTADARRRQNAAVGGNALRRQFAVQQAELNALKAAAKTLDLARPKSNLRGRHVGAIKAADLVKRSASSDATRPKWKGGRRGRVAE